MPKIDIETLKFILQRNEPDIRKIASIMQEIELELKAEEEEKALRPPAVKKQNVMMISDPDGIYKEKDMVGWIAQIPEDDDIATTAGRIHSAAHEFNTTPKGITAPTPALPKPEQRVRRRGHTHGRPHPCKPYQPCIPCTQ